MTTQYYRPVLAASLAILWSCDSNSSNKHIDCFELYTSNDTSAIADSCSVVMAKDYKSLCAKKYDSIRNLALSANNQYAILLADFSNEEGILTLIVWRNGIAQIINNDMPPGLRIKLNSKSSIISNEIAGQRDDAWSISSSEMAEPNNIGNKIRYFKHKNNMLYSAYSTLGETNYQKIHQIANSIFEESHQNRTAR